MSHEIEVLSGPAFDVTQGFCREIQESNLEDLFAACMPRLAKTARRLIHNAEDSEDLLQESLLSAFKNLHQFQGRSKFSTWLHSIVRNKAKMQMRKAGAHRCCSLEEVTTETGELLIDLRPDVGPNAEAACLESERSQILRRILLDVLPGYRTVIQLCDIEGLDGKSAAVRLGLSVSGLKTRLHRARKAVALKIRESDSPTQSDFATRAPSREDRRILQKGSAGRTGSQPSERKATSSLSAEKPACDLQHGSEKSPDAWADMRRRAAGVRHERQKGIGKYYCVGADHGVRPCELSSAL